MTFDDSLPSCRACGRPLETLPPRASGRSKLLADRPGIDMHATAAPAAQPVVVAGGEPRPRDGNREVPPTGERRRPRGGWAMRLLRDAKANALLFAAIVAAGLGWGVAIGIVSTREPKPQVLPTLSAATSDVANDLAERLQARDREIATLGAQYRSARTELDVTRRRLNAQATDLVLTSSNAQRNASNALNAERNEVNAQALTLGGLRTQVAGLRSDNSGLERNYNDLLDALHRTQNQVFQDQRELVASAKATEAAAAKCLIRRTRNH